MMSPARSNLRVVCHTIQTPGCRIVVVILSFLLFSFPSFLFIVHGQTNSAKAGTAKSKTNQGRKPRKSKANQNGPTNELAKLREEFIKATNDYKTSLEKLRASYEKNVARAEAELTKSKELFAAGLISKQKVEAGEAEVAAAKGKISEVDNRMTAADSQIGETLLEADAETKLARSGPVPRGGFMRTTALIRYNGAAFWALSEAWKVQQFFQNAFKKPLPVAVFGQGAIHDRWHLDHRNAIDVSLHPDGAEGQALMGFLRANGIPFLAFRQAIPGTATGPHIHIGRPSHRYRADSERYNDRGSCFPSINTAALAR